MNLLHSAFAVLILVNAAVASQRRVMAIEACCRGAHGCPADAVAVDVRRGAVCDHTGNGLEEADAPLRVAAGAMRRHPPV